MWYHLFCKEVISPLESNKNVEFIDNVADIVDIFRKFL